LWAAAAAVVLHQTCQLANKHYGLACAKAEFGERVLADVVVAIITKVFQTLCIGHVTCVCVLDVANTMFVAEQPLKSGHGMMYIQ
jgi:hypothetical protein